MIDLSFYTSYKELYQQASRFARKKVTKVYQETQNKSFTKNLRLNILNKFAKNLLQGALGSSIKNSIYRFSPGDTFPVLK